MYIYLNTYEGGYLYVGQHSWNGDGMDPYYHGSSKVAKRFGWKPVKEEILEIVPEDRKLIAESEWIEKYAEVYGIADCALVLAPDSRHWHKKFKSHGRLLNCQTSSSQQLHSPEAVRKAVDDRIRSGVQKKAQMAATSAREKAIKTRCKNARHYKVVLPNGESCIGSNSQVGRFVIENGINSRIDGILSQVRLGVQPNPHIVSRGKLKGILVEAL